LKQGQNQDHSTMERYSLDVSVVVMEHEEEWLVLRQVSYEVVDLLFEFGPRDFDARSKVIIL
jgi:hypothetical protein